MGRTGTGQDTLVLLIFCCCFFAFFCVCSFRGRVSRTSTRGTGVSWSLMCKSRASTSSPTPSCRRSRPAARSPGSTAWCTTSRRGCLKSSRSTSRCLRVHPGPHFEAVLLYVYFLYSVFPRRRTSAPAGRRPCQDTIVRSCNNEQHEMLCRTGIIWRSGARTALIIEPNPLLELRQARTQTLRGPSCLTAERHEAKPPPLYCERTKTRVPSTHISSNPYNRLCTQRTAHTSTGHLVAVPCGTHSFFQNPFIYFFDIRVYIYTKYRLYTKYIFTF